MRTLFIYSVPALCGCLSLSSSGCSSHNPASDSVQTTSEAVSSDLVPVPGTGKMYHKSCVHEVPNGSTIKEVGKDYQVWLDGKLVANYQQCAYVPSYVPSGNGWVESTDEQVPDVGYHFSQMRSRMVVPSDPVNQNALIYLFQSWEDVNEVYILQPVLQWGVNPNTGDGGHYWLYAGWYVPSLGFAFHTPYLSVYAGHTLEGYMSEIARGIGCPAPTQDYVSATDVTTNQSVGIYVPVITYTRAQSAVLEARFVTSCDQFPASSTSFTAPKPSAGGILLESYNDGSGSGCVTKDGNPGGLWTTRSAWSLNGFPACPYSVTVGTFGDSTLAY